MLFRANFAAVVVLALTLSAYAAPSVGDDTETVEAALTTVQDTAGSTARTSLGQLNDSHAGSASSAPAGGITPEPNAKVSPPGGRLPKRTPIDVNGAWAHIFQRIHEAEGCIADSIQTCIDGTGGSAKDCLAGSSKECFVTLVSSITGRAIQRTCNQLEAINPNPTTN